MSHIRLRLFAHTFAIVMASLFLLPSTTTAQMIGGNIKGDVGLKAGSQPPPGTYVAIPLYFYTADAVKDRNGNQILTGSLDSALFGAALTVVTTKKVLGGTYGFVAVLPLGQQPRPRD
jgi:hypothetical protein